MNWIKTWGLFILICLVSISCSGLMDSLTGPNRNFKMIGSENTSDFITFEGFTLTGCRNLTVDNYGETINVGCVFRVQLTGHSNNTREVFCTADIYNECRSIPIGSRVSINGTLMTPSAIIQAKSTEWRTE